MRSPFQLALLIALALSSGCQQDVVPRRAFYFWRTQFALSVPEREVLTRQRVSRIYLRLFDVVPGGVAGELSFEQRPPPDVEIVPVVYLASATLQVPGNPDRLGEEIVRRVTASVPSFHELQLDCDWTDSTRDRFFATAAAVRRRISPARLSVTIRLHQIKYRERTGVPPADRGMLMFYNMGEISPGASSSAIFDAEIARRYTSRLGEYPLPLDVALPIFSWAVHVREGRVVGLIEKPDLDSLRASTRELAPDRFVADSAMWLRGSYLRAGDSLEIDTVSPETALAAARVLGERFHPRSTFSVALFDLDARNLEPYASQDLDRLFDAVR